MIAVGIAVDCELCCALDVDARLGCLAFACDVVFAAEDLDFRKRQPFLTIDDLDANESSGDGLTLVLHNFGFPCHLCLL